MSAKAFAILMTLLAIALGSWSGYQYNQSVARADTLDELRQANAELTTANRQQERDLDRLRAERDRLVAQLDDLSAEQSDIAGSLTALEQQVLDLTAERDELATELADTTGQQETLDGDLASVRAERDELLAERDELHVVLDEREAELAALDAELAERESSLEQTQARLSGREETMEELESRLTREQQALDDLQSRLNLAEEERQQLVDQRHNGQTLIQLPERILFPTGSATLNEESVQVLREVAVALESFPDYTLSVVGHSDTRSISSSLQAQYPTNWELSAARASAAVRVLASLGISEQRMKATGVAATQPLVEEVDAASRQQNRRIEIILEPPLPVETL
ncbi:hypothetical protein E4656_05400 [Natronospirillum operosum]|uniref:OmpA-like domain-containing protein n=1 Tax=Natronospirillum operosum TaxID=2759953 RepID=A0A4Z0WFN3_9GAMM|nr:OmpA family protein [Natronospirillum operosum]TGG95840.1 hypothetical protein E4656_05400 [Natronospirillum operosum]